MGTYHSFITPPLRRHQDLDIIDKVKLELERLINKGAIEYYNFDEKMCIFYGICKNYHPGFNEFLSEFDVNNVTLVSVDEEGGHHYYE